MRSIPDRVAARFAAGEPTGPYAHIKRMTRRNDHAAAYLAGAKELGLKQLVKKFSLTKELMELEGHMPSGLGAYQYELLQDMLKAAKQTLAPESYEDFYMSF